MIRTTLLIAAMAAVARAQNIPASASESDLQTVAAQYEAAGFDRPLTNSQSFNIPLENAALLTVVYGNTVVSNGQSLAQDQVAQFPTVYVTPTTISTNDFAANRTFTLALADASAAGLPDPRGDYRHFLANGIPGGAPASGGNLTFSLNVAAGQTVTQYAGPGPIAGSGAHRYCWMLFAQPANFAPPANASGNQPAGPWSVQQYVQATDLDLVAASFFTVQIGQPTFSPVATSSVAPVTASRAATTSGGASTPAPSGSARASAAGASTSAKSGAGFLAPAAGLGAVAAVVAGAVVMA